MLALLQGWTASGSSRLDRDEDGAIDAGAAPAIWDELYPRRVDAVLGGVLGPQLAEFKTLVGTDTSPGTGFTNGAINRVDNELRTLTGTRFREPFRTRFCGQADACRAKLWAAMEQTGTALEQRQGTADPAAWRADANAERITFAPGLLPLRIRYTNRPSGIQQAVSFSGHRPRR